MEMGPRGVDKTQTIVCERILVFLFGISLSLLIVPLICSICTKLSVHDDKMDTEYISLALSIIQKHNMIKLLIASANYNNKHLPLYIQMSRAYILCDCDSVQ